MCNAYFCGFHFTITMGFYITLPSRSSADTYPENNPGNYKVKLAKTLFMIENDWEVALASISFPDLICANGTYQKQNGNHDLRTRIPMIMHYKMFCKVLYDDGQEIPVTRDGKRLKDKDGNDLFIHNVGGPVRLDLVDREVTFSKSIQNGYEFWGHMTNLLVHEMYRTFEDVNDIRGGSGKRLAEWTNKTTGKGKHTHFEWVKNTDEYDFKINNEEVVYMDVFPRTRKDSSGAPVTYFLEELAIEYLKENYVDIELGVAKSFNLVEQIDKDGVVETTLSSRVRIEHFRDPIYKGGENPKKAKLWEIVSYIPLAHDLSITISFVRSYSFVNWYFSGLKMTFHEKFVDPTRSYTDLTQTQIVGGTETELLREVTINSSVKGRKLYEPRNLQFLPIRKNIFDTVQVGVSETDGTQTKFFGGETILTVKFRRRSEEEEYKHNITRIE